MVYRKKGLLTSIINTCIHIFKVCLKEYPAYFITTILVSIVHAFSGVLDVYANQRIIESLTAYSGDLRNLIFSFTLISFVILGSIVLNGIHNFMFAALQKKIAGSLRRQIHTKIGKLPAIFFQDSGKLDDINRAEEGMQSAFMLFTTVLFLAVFYLPYFIFLSIYLAKLSPILSIIIIIVFIPTALSQTIRYRTYSKLEKDIAIERRQKKHYEDCIISKEFFKETRTLGATGFFMDLLNKTIISSNAKGWRAEKKATFYEAICQLLLLIAHLSIIILLVVELNNGNLSIGAFVAVFSSIISLFGIMDELINRHIGSIMQNFGTVNNYISFLKLPVMESTINRRNSFNRNIILENASFSYPNVPNVLKNINIEIKKNETIAIVGPNGAGKSTLAKIILGLYTIDTGKFIVDDKDIEVFGNPLEATATFQSFMRYKLSLEENITISNITKDINSLEAENILFKVGMGKLVNSLKIPLAKEFDGVELSGGEWQRIAIARGLYRANNIICLDEPTASIDPNKEYEIYSSFRKIACNTTAVLITHRVGSAKLADRIIVLNKGSIVETGTHDELMMNKSLYYEMYKKQAAWYL